MADPTSRICLSLTATTLEENLRLLESRRAFADMAELRADLLDPAELSHVPAFPRRAGVPLIFTIRRERDGGGWSGEESERRRLFTRALDGEYTYVELEADLDDDALSASVSTAGGRVVRSRHECDGAPNDLAGAARGLARRPGEIPKITVMPGSTQDLPALLAACREIEDREKILLGMGEFGLFSRILATKLGNLWTYCSAAGSPGADPGALDPRTLVELYRFRKQGRDTFVCGVIGNPIAHSRSPEFHNRGYEALGLNGVYVPFLVDDVPAFFDVAERLDLRGFSVTMPHKRAVLPHLDDGDQSLEQIGACNTVVRREAGWYGTNTDVEGFLGPLRLQAPGLIRPGTKAAVIGAGGGARSVVHALCSCGIRPLILNRTEEKAKILAEFFGCEWAGLDRKGVSRMQDHADLIVQATGVGMDPQADADPLPGYRFSGSEVVYDLVYKPLLTVFLKRAQQAGCRIVSGLDMLFTQGAAQFKHYTGVDYPLELLDSTGYIAK